MLLPYLTCKSQNSNLPGMASISHSFLPIYLAFSLCVVTIILNSHLKENDCGQFSPFTFAFKRKSQKESILANAHFCCLPFLHCQKTSSEEPILSVIAVLLYIYIVLWNWCLNWLSLRQKNKIYHQHVKPFHCADHSAVIWK